MAKFDIAYQLTARSEGGYANHPKDSGGETAFGLTRRDWPNWSGWLVIDRLKRLYGVPKAIPMVNANQELKKSVRAVFKANYWDICLCDQVKDQQVANQIFDTAINMGSGTAAKLMQRTARVKVDLHVGPITIGAVNAMNPAVFHARFIAGRKAIYDAIIRANPSQIVFKKGWYSRLKPDYIKNIA